MELEGALVLVTGGSRGIGAALAFAYADEGASVVVAARSEGDLRQVAERIGGVAHVADLSDPEVVDGLVAAVEAAYGPVDVLVNNAGIETVDPVATVDPDSVRTAARVNLEAPMVLTRRVLPGMLERNRGAVVFMSSLAGTAGFPGMGPYCATKAGLNNFAASLRIELKGTPISTTLVAPGPSTRACGMRSSPASRACSAPTTGPEAAVDSQRRHPIGWHDGWLRPRPRVADMSAIPGASHSTSGWERRHAGSPNCC